MRDPDEGVVLVNVLVVLGLAATIVYAMLTVSELAVSRSQRFSEAGQGLALIRAGEQSAIAALRRDLVEAPDADHPGEAWSAAEQQAIEIAGGSFELAIEDAQGLVNLNALAGGGLQAEETLRSILTAVEAPPELAARILASLALDGPLKRIEDLAARIGVAPDDIAKLGGFVTALPGLGDVNMNAAPVELLAVLLNNPGLARSLVNRRDRAGFLTLDDVDAVGLVLPPGIGFSSALFRVRTTVRVGDAVQSVESLLRRSSGGDGPEVVVIGRRNAMAAAPAPPPSS